MGIALGNVIWQDTSADLSILCAQADYDEKTDYLKAFGGQANRPLLITIMDGDSLFLTADTLIAFRPLAEAKQTDKVQKDAVLQDTAHQVPVQLDSLPTDSIRLDTVGPGFKQLAGAADSTATPASTATSDSSRILNAFRDVRILKSNLQAVCDSLSYSTVDSMFRLYKKPIIWSDTSQFNSDTVFIQLANDKIDQILLRSRALIVNSPDELFFNQIRGSNITAYLEESEVRKMDVVGTAQSIYYSLDDTGAYMGV
ncbi:MAG: hypothetical protein KDC44_07930, partial [Phaeodactylibacter sp.]|nr:hypothetical protein [Phaeodactylibacter sp.]